MTMNALQFRINSVAIDNSRQEKYWVNISPVWGELQYKGESKINSSSGPKGDMFCAYGYSYQEAIENAYAQLCEVVEYTPEFLAKAIYPS